MNYSNILIQHVERRMYKLYSNFQINMNYFIDGDLSIKHRLIISNFKQQNMINKFMNVFIHLIMKVTLLLNIFGHV
jgi:hypothetical protein